MVLQSTQAITTRVHAMQSTATTRLPRSPEHQLRQAREVVCVPGICLPPNPLCLAQKLLQN